MGHGRRLAANLRLAASSFGEVAQLLHPHCFLAQLGFRGRTTAPLILKRTLGPASPLRLLSGTTGTVANVSPNPTSRTTLTAIDRLGHRRGAAVLTAMVIVIAIICLAGAWPLWPLLAIPALVAVPVGGREALIGVSAAIAIVLTLLAGQPGPDGRELATGFVVLVGLGFAGAMLSKERTREIERPASRGITDRLTGLGSYAYLREMLDLECRRADRHGRPLALAILDIDGMRSVNEREGHDTGNRLLAAIGDELFRISRGTDILGRTGSDELALIVPGGAAEAVEAAERLRTAIADVVLVGATGREVRVTASGGVAAHWKDATASDLIDRAQEALRAAKRAGRDQVHSIEGQPAADGAVAAA